MLGKLRFGQENGVPPALTGTVGLIDVTGAVTFAYLAATRAAGRRGHTSSDRTPDELAHSIVLIATGYLIAHSYSLPILEAKIFAGHALMQNLRRSHYELGLDTQPHLRVAAAFNELARAI